MSAAWIEAGLRGVVEWAAAAMLLLALAALLARRAGLLVGLVAAQAVLLALILLAEAWLRADWPLAAVAGLTVAAKAVALPWGLRALAPALGDPPRRGPAVPAAGGVALAGVVMVLAAPPAGLVMALALAVVAVGGLAASWRRDPAGQTVGVLVLENGLVLAIATAALPGAAALALASGMVSAAVLLGLVRRVLPAAGAP